MQGLRALVYKLKRSIHANPKIYGPAFSLLTLNPDRVRNYANRKLFPSRFGGMWTDREDYRKILDRKLARKEISEREAVLVEQWHEQGFVIFEGAIGTEDVDALVAEFDALPQSHPAGLKITGGGHSDGRLYRPELIKPHDSIRIVDLYFFSERARALLFHRSIMRFLRMVFEAEPMLTQSLSFEHGSEQEIHQDTAFVIMNSPLKFAASWIALEDIQEGSGELVYYPGSHRWKDFLFSGRYKHWDRERDGQAQLRAWYDWMRAEAEKRGVEKQYFRPKKGDLLLWHGGLAHGGAPIRNNALTRRSLVGHYCAEGIRPLYHYYKPAHKSIYSIDGRRFSSSHYLPDQLPRKS